MTNRGTLLALGLAIAFFVLATAVWVNLDTVPPLWDQAQYLQESEILYHTLRQSGPVAFLSAFSETLKIKAPLITALPIPLYAVLGESHLSARYVNLFFIVIASWYLYRLGEILAGRGAALLGVIVLNTFPMVAGISRQVLVEYGLMTLAVLWVYHLVRWQRGHEKRSSWALGAVLGLGMLMKVSFPLYVAAPTAWVLAQDVLRHRKLRPALLSSLARIAALAIPIAGIWYFKNWRSVFGFVARAGYGELAGAYGKGNVFSARTVGAYWLDLVNFGIGAPYLVLLALAGGGLLLRRRMEEKRPDRADLHLLLAWWIAPWLALTFAVSKDVRFAMAYLPALALLIGAGFAAIPARRLRIAAMALTAALALSYYVFYSFGMRSGGTDLRAGRLILFSQNLRWAHPPITEHWPNEDLVRLVAADGQRTGIVQPRATVLFSHPRLSSHNLNYLGALHQLPVRFNTCNFQAPDTSRELADRVRTQSDYVITKTGSLGLGFLNTKNSEVLALLQKDGFPFDPIGTLALPDQSEATVFRRREHGYRVWRPEDAPSRIDLRRPRVARFGRSIALVESEVAEEARGLRLRLVWECTGTMDKDYRVLVHAFGEKGLHTIADHYPGRGQYHTSRWKVGDIVEQEVWIPSPPSTKLRIYVGWYLVEQLEQLPVEAEAPADPREPNAVRVY